MRIIFQLFTFLIRPLQLPSFLYVTACSVLAMSFTFFVRVGAFTNVNPEEVISLRRFTIIYEYLFSISIYLYHHLYISLTYLIIYLSISLSLSFPLSSSLFLSSFLFLSLLLCMCVFTYCLSCPLSIYLSINPVCNLSCKCSFCQFRVYWIRWTVFNVALYIFFAVIIILLGTLDLDQTVGSSCGGRYLIYYPALYNNLLSAITVSLC